MKLDGITIAAVNMEAMINFYNTVLGAELAAMPDTPFYRGTLAGIPVVLCPNEIPQIKAEKNRHQFRFAVNDLDAVVNKAIAVGSAKYGEFYDNDVARGGAILDPDGNSIELIEYH